MHATIGTGCNGLVASSTGGGVGATLTFTSTAGPANAPAVLLIGVMELPAPIPVPNSPACFVFQDFPALLPTTLSAAGAGSVVIPVPMSPAFRSQTVYGQYAVVNGQRIDTAASRRVTMYGVHDTARIYNLTSNTSLTGSVQQSVGLVTRLGY